MQRLYWCVGCEFPALEPRVCFECGCEAVEIVGVRGDYYPMFEFDWQIVRDAIRWSLGVDDATAVRLAPGGAGVKAKVDALEVAYLMVYGGGVAGVLEFEWKLYRWTFSPRGWLASLIYREGIGYTAHVPITPSPGDVLAWSVVKGEVPNEVGKRVVARDKAGRIVVLRVEHGGLRVERVEAFREDASYPKPGDTRRMYECAWRARVEGMLRKAVEWSRSIMARYGSSVLRLSGGKDSTVAAYVFTEAGGRHILFTDTGWEFPETLETIDRLSRMVSNVEVVTPPRDCWSLLEAYGPPARDYRWCTQACKLGPASAYIERLGAKLVFAGTRALESPSRAKQQKLSRSRGAGGGELLASPLLEWNALDVFTAVYALRLPLNPLYEAGYERVGCFNCPASTIPEFLETARRHPELWERWRSFLERYARERDLPSAWLKLHLWRWRFKPPPRVERAAREYGVRWDRLVRRTWVTRIIEAGGDVPSVRLYNPLAEKAGLARLRETGKALGALWARTERHIAFRPSKTSMVVFYEGGEIYVEGGSWDEVKSLAEEAVRAAAMAAACTGCMLCVKKCPKDAIRVVDSTVLIDERRCIACRKCLYVCPVAGYALLSQAVGLQATIDAMLAGELD